MGKITPSVLATLFVVGVSASAMAQGTSMPSHANSPSSETTMPNSGTGSATSAKIATPTQAKSKLEESGYTSVSGIEKSANGFTAMAKKDGKSVRVAIDQQGNIETR